MRTSWGSATDRGRVRALNEDALLAYPPVFLVADGMGGHAAGDVASRVAVEEFSQLAGRTSVGADEVHACFERIAARVRDLVPAGRTGGTTVTGLAVAPDDGGSYWLVFNVGDSRVYRLAEGRLEQITVDHSVVQELLDAGRLSPEDARDHPERHVITRAVGTGPLPEPDYWMLPAAPGDRMLLCSDGLTTELTDDVVADVLRRLPDAQEAAQALVTAALEAGGRDNVTVVVVDVAVVHGENDTDVTTGPEDGEVDVAARSQAAWDEILHGATVPRPTRPRPVRPTAGPDGTPPQTDRPRTPEVPS